MQAMERMSFIAIAAMVLVAKSMCSENCKTKYTIWDLIENGESYYLDRHEPKCDSGSMLSMFHLERHDANIRYKYSCCKLNKPGITSPSEKENEKTYGGHGNTWFLDRQIVSCGSTGLLSSFKLVRDGYKIWYKYTCNNLKSAEDRKKLQCYKDATPFTEDGEGKAVYLDRQTVQSETGSFLAHFQLKRSYRRGRWRYVFTCCSIGFEQETNLVDYGLF